MDRAPFRSAPNVFSSPRRPPLTPPALPRRRRRPLHPTPPSLPLPPPPPSALLFLFFFRRVTDKENFHAKNIENHLLRGKLDRNDRVCLEFRVIGDLQFFSNTRRIG